MAGKVRKGIKYTLLAFGAAFGIYTGAAMKDAYDHGERTATISYGQLQDIVGDDNPIITELDLSLGRGNSDFEAFVSLALGGDVDFSNRLPHHPALFDWTLREQVDIHHQAMRQEECTNDLCYPPPQTVEDMISLAARITESNLEFDYEAHFIHHTEQAFDNDHVLGGIVEFVIRSAEVGIEYAHVAAMAPDEILHYRKGMCEQYADVFTATLSRLNELFGSPYDLSVGKISYAPGDQDNIFYEGLSRLLNLYYFHRNSGFTPHIANVVIAHDPARFDQPAIYFIDAQLVGPFDAEDQIISVDRERFSRFSAALTLAEDYSVRAYSRSHDFNRDGAMWDHIVIADGSARILTQDLRVREDVVRYIRSNTDPTLLTLPEIALLQRYVGPATRDGILECVGNYGWLASRLRANHRGRFSDTLVFPDVSAGTSMDASVPSR